MIALIQALVWTVVERDADTRSPAPRQGEQGESRRWLGMSRAIICRKIREYGIIALSGV